MKSEIKTGITEKMISLTDPDPNLIHIEDIAHALSHICRFTGHTKEFYSVLNHTINCYILAKDHYPDNPRIQYGALMHDCAEAYLQDLSSPLKQLFPDYKFLENKWDQIIFDKFNVQLSDEEYKAVKLIDLSMLFIEANKLFSTGTKDWSVNGSGRLEFKIQRPLFLANDFTEARFNWKYIYRNLQALI